MIDKKKFKNPEAEVIDFNNDDIITLSNAAQAEMTGGLFGNDDNTEDWA